MPIPLNQVRHAEVLLRGTITTGGAGQFFTDNIFRFRRQAVSVDPTKAALQTAFQTAIATPIIAALNVRWSQESLWVRWLNDAEDPYVTYSHINVGAIVGDSMPARVSAYLLGR